MGKIYYRSTNDIWLTPTNPMVNAPVVPTSITFVPVFLTTATTIGTIVGTASAADTDSGYVWALLSNPGNRYAIDSVTGVVTVVASLLIRTDVLIIQVTAGSQSYSQSFNVPVIANPTTITDITLSSSTGFANSSVDTVLGTLNAVSGDVLQNPVWSLSNSDGGNFKIIGTTIYFATSSVPQGSPVIQVHLSADNVATAFTKNFTLTINPAIALALIDTPTQAWIQITHPMPTMGVTLTGISTAYAVLSIFGNEEGSRVSFTTSLPTLTPAHLGTYTIQVFDSPSGGVRIGESAPITVWTASNGPASAAVAIDSVPSTVTQGQVITVTGTAITANNYILVSYTFPYVGQFLAYQAVPIDPNVGTWSFSVLDNNVYGDSYIDVLDPSTGQHLESGHISNIAINSNASPVFGFSSSNQPPATNRTLATENTPRIIGSVSYAVGSSNPYGDLSKWVFNKTDDSNGVVYQPIPGFLYIKNPVPGTHTVHETLSYFGQPDIPFTYDFYIPWSVPPTDITFTPNGSLNDQLPAGWLVGTLASYTADGTVVFTCNDINHNFLVDNGNQILIANQMVAGSYNVDVTVTDGNYSFTKRFVIEVAVATIIDSNNITFIPNTLTNVTPPGATIGVPSVSGLSGTPVWGIIQSDVGKRLAINPTTGYVTNAKYLSAITGSELGTLVVTDGTNVCIKPITIPVDAPPGPILEVGIGKTYATIGAALDHFYSDPTGTLANSTIKIYPGIYSDDIAISNQSQFRRDYLNGPIKFLGVLDNDGKRPLITYSTFPAALAVFKGAFVSDGWDLWIENIEVSQARSADAGSHSFLAAFRQGDHGPDNITCMSIKNCIAHDCDMGFMGGVTGSRHYIYDTLFAYCGEGSGFTHNVYCGDAAIFHVERCVFYATSRGHLFKSRAAKTDIIDCVIINGNDGFSSSCVDIPDGGILTVQNTILYQGPNTDRGAVINFGNELLGLHPVNSIDIHDCTIYNLVPFDYYLNGHNIPSGIENNFDTNPNKPSYLSNATTSVTNTSISNEPNGRDLLGNLNVSGITHPTVIPPYDFIFPGTGGGYKDTHVGPCLKPFSDYSYVTGWGGLLVPTKWSEDTDFKSKFTIPHTANIGDVVATPHTFNPFIPQNADKTLLEGPFTYSKIYGSNALAVASDGTITVNGVLTQNTFITIAIDAQNNTQYASATLNNPGTYDPFRTLIITISDSDGVSSRKASLVVTTDGNGHVNQIAFFDRGQYSQFPSVLTGVPTENPVDHNSRTPVSGSGLTVDLIAGGFHNPQLVTFFIV